MYSMCYLLVSRNVYIFYSTYSKISQVIDMKNPKSKTRQIGILFDIGVSYITSVEF